MTTPIDGIVPVMLTPFTPDNRIDEASLERLVEWYLANGSDALFAVCQSSEMQFLDLGERVALARAVCRMTAGRAPVLASGHISGEIADQKAELSAMADTGIDCLVLVTNRLDPSNSGGEAFRAHLGELLASLPADLPLGLYECPAPYRRLLSDDELKFCRDTGRFVALKDVSCDLETVRRRVGIVAGSPLNIVNANAAIAFEALRAGSTGFAGVFTNFHPDLYAWMYRNRAEPTPLVRELAVFLALAANAEPLGYPKLAKIHQQRLGNFTSDHCRVIDFDIREKFWALDAILGHIVNGETDFRRRIAEAERAASA